jgi:hypothetical protein
MQAWQIKTLKLEGSALDDLNGFVRDHALYFLIAIVGLVVVLLAWVLSGGLRRRFKQLSGTVHPAIFICSSGPPPPEKGEFHPFPSPHYTAQGNDNDDDWD